MTIALAAAGASVVLSGRRRDKLEESVDAARSLGAVGERCVVLPCDICDEGDVVRAVNSIGAESPYLHGLVSCAAVPEPGAVPSPLSNLPTRDWYRMFATNVMAQWLVAKMSRPLLMSHQGSRIVFFSSEAGWADTPGFGPYNMTKSALNTLGVSLAAEWARDFPDRDVQVNVLVPGEARTEMNQGSPNSPFRAVSMTLALLSHPPGGPSGRLFHRDGRHLEFAYSKPHGRDVFSD